MLERKEVRDGKKKAKSIYFVSSATFGLAHYVDQCLFCSPPKLLVSTITTQQVHSISFKQAGCASDICTGQTYGDVNRIEDLSISSPTRSERGSIERLILGEEEYISLVPDVCVILSSTLTPLELSLCV